MENARITSLFVLISVLTISLVQAQDSIVIKTPAKQWTMKMCVDYALEHNMKVKQSLLSMDDSKTDKISAIANFLPSLSANGNHSWNQGLNTNITTGILQKSTTQYTSFGIGGSIVIFSGLKNMRQLSRANLQILASRYQLDNIKDNVTLSVINAYLQIVFNQEMLASSKAQMQSVQENYKTTKKLVNHGSLPQGDLLQIEANIYTQEQKIIQAKNSIEISRLNLAQLLLVDSLHIASVDPDKEVFESTTILNNADKVYDKALQHMNTIKVSEIAIDIAKKDLQLARSAYYPTLRGAINYNTRASYNDRIVGSQIDADNPTRTIGFLKNNNNETVVTNNFRNIVGPAQNVFDQFKNNEGTSYALSLSIPILQGLSARLRVMKSKNEIVRKTMQLEQSKLDLRKNVYTAWNDVRASYQSYLAAKKTLIANEKVYQYAQNKLKQGVFNSFEYTQAQQNLQIANNDLIRYKFDYLFKLKILEYYFDIPVSEL